MLTTIQCNAISRLKNGSVEFRKNDTIIKVTLDQFRDRLEYSKNGNFIGSFENLEALNEHSIKYGTFNEYVQV